MDETTTVDPKTTIDAPKDILQPEGPADDYIESDIFAWANNLFEYKEDLKMELFWINKNNVVYRTQLDAQLQKQLQPLFLDGILEYVLEGANEGMVVRNFEDAEAEEKVLQRTKWKNVEKLREVMHWIRTQEHEIELFKDEEHDLKRLKGAIVRVSHPKMPQPFYIMKALPTSQILKGEGIWMAQGVTFKPFDTAAMHVPNDSQMMILDQDLYVFNQAKLDRLFSYNAKKNSIAEKKVQEIEKHFKFSFAEGVDMQSAIAGSKALINKLQKIDPEQVTQEQLLDHAEEMGVEMMTDDAGAIIIMNAKDLAKFVNLLNDDYIESPLTGLRYEIQRKRLLKPAAADEML